MTFEQYKDTQDLLAMYLTKLTNIVSKRSSVTVVMDEESNTSHYADSESVIVLNNSENQTKFHEFGHHIYYRNNGKNIINSREFVQLIGENISLNKSVEDAVAILDLYKEEYGINSNSLSILSDFLGIALNEVFPGYRCHKKDYAFLHSPDIAKNESFANFCGLIAIKDVRGLFFYMKIFPYFVNSCFDLIDKAVREMTIV